MHLNVGQAISNLNTLPGRIAAVIDARFASITDAASRVGMSRTSVSQWVAGHKTPDTQNLGRFANVADVSLSWLMDGTGPVPDLTPKTKIKRAKSEAAKPEPAKGLRAFAALSLSRGIILESIRSSMDGVCEWMESTPDPLGQDYAVVPIDIRLTAA